jgi:hypothetical protein
VYAVQEQITQRESMAWALLFNNSAFLLFFLFLAFYALGLFGAAYQYALCSLLSVVSWLLSVFYMLSVVFCLVFAVCCLLCGNCLLLSAFRPFRTLTYHDFGSILCNGNRMEHTWNVM